MKRAFNSSSEPPPPVEPVQDVKTVELTFQLGDKEKNNEELKTNDEFWSSPFTSS